MGWTPHDLPHLAAKTADTLTDTQAEFRALAHHPAADVEQVTQIADAMGATIEIMGAPLTWLDASICRMVEETHTTVPEWTPGEILPSPIGMVAFDKPVATVPYEGKQVRVDAVGWIYLGDGVWVEMYSRDAESGGHLASGPLGEIFHIIIPIDVATGRGTQSGVMMEGAELSADDANDALSIVGAMWLILSQPQVVEEGQPVTARVRRKVGISAGRRREVKVSTRTLTRRAGGGQGSKRGGATTRWWVRGHWRQQAYGEGRKLRRPVFIAPHTAGAKDAPVDPRPQVQVRKG